MNRYLKYILITSPITIPFFVGLYMLKIEEALKTVSVLGLVTLEFISLFIFMHELNKD